MSPENKEILIFKSVEEISDFAIEKWIKIADKAVKDRGHFTVAVSGGQTPVVLYQKLADSKKPLPWDKTHIFLVDERFVPYNNGESNYGMINQILIKNLKIPGNNIHPISTKTGNPQTSAKKYEEDLISFFSPGENELPKFDLILLGIGEDGHTASLFPGTLSLAETRHLSVAVSLTDTSKKDRITLTFPVINNAENIVFLASGSNKARVLKEVIEAENNSFPASQVRPEKGNLFFLLDENAGSLLSRE